MASPTIMFAKFNVTSSVFHLTPLTFSIVNLKPLLPGHVLVCPRRVTARLSDLTAAELTDLFRTTQQVSRMLERVYCGGKGALNVAVQDGQAAGQSVPHVHVHLIPRKQGDLPPDAVYGMLEGEQGDVGRHWAEKVWTGYQEGTGERPKFDKVEETERRDRTEGEMKAEADKLRREMEREREVSPGLFAVL